MSLVGNTKPRRLLRLTIFSIVTARFSIVVFCGAGWATSSLRSDADKNFLLNGAPMRSLAELDDLGRRDAAGYFEYSNRAGNIDEIARQRRAARIDHQRIAVAHDTFAMAVALHDAGHRTAA